MYNIKEFSKLTGLSISTLRRYDDILKPLRTPGGKRRYTDEHLKMLYKLGKIKKSNTEEYDTIIYCRVSTSKQKNNLENQIEYCEKYCVANGWQISKIIKDIGSAVNFSRNGLKELLKICYIYKPKRIVISDKDRLARIGFDLFKTLFDILGIELIVINQNNTKYDKIQDIVEELVHIIHLYAMKIYGTRNYKKIKKLKDEVLKDVGVEEEKES
jgi:predicted site-specific integrase-resolvase